ncbi:hypothetical protein DPMN_122484 [Dreissena polymorpha]|uniref:Uncharacterized protein n=2 Tax=Dreissena polymorpha TaxID=45954 RepID=A0A9D4GPI4_DREPO|nr:hypothetical protein DPMN_122484 [Dreissena polymorpha]
MNPRGSPCMCCGRKSYDTARRSCSTFPRKYEYDEDGRRYHLDDNGMACYYDHKNKSHGKVVHYGIDGSSEASTPRPTFVNAVNEVIVERRTQPAKEILAWKPHTNSVRNINTSTK